MSVLVVKMTQVHFLDNANNPSNAFDDDGSNATIAHSGSVEPLLIHDGDHDGSDLGTIIKVESVFEIVSLAGSIQIATAWAGSPLTADTVSSPGIHRKDNTSDRTWSWADFGAANLGVYASVVTTGTFDGANIDYAWIEVTYTPGGDNAEILEGLHSGEPGGIFRGMR